MDLACPWVCKWQLASALLQHRRIGTAIQPEASPAVRVEGAELRLVQLGHT